MSPVGSRMPAGHTAKAPDGTHEWDKNVRCTVCDRPLVWVRGSSHKSARWQHDRFA